MQCRYDHRKRTPKYPNYFSGTVINLPRENGGRLLSISLMALHPKYLALVFVESFYTSSNYAYKYIRTLGIQFIVCEAYYSSFLYTQSYYRSNEDGIQFSDPSSLLIFEVPMRNTSSTLQNLLKNLAVCLGIKGCQIYS